MSRLTSSPSWINLDQAATSSPKPSSVIARWKEMLDQPFGNPGRGSHQWARAASSTIDTARKQAAGYLGVHDARRIVFTSSATESLNLAIKGTLKAGDHVVTGTLEHNSVLRPLMALKRAGLIEVTIVPADPNGFYQPDAIMSALHARTKMVALTHVSNTLGTIQPVMEIGKICRARKITFLVDGCQSAGVVATQLSDAPIDLWATSAHKSMFGPTGVGLLYVHPAVAIQPLRHGGTGFLSAAEYAGQEFPFDFEAGTVNTMGIAQLSASLDYLKQQAVSEVLDHERSLLLQLHDGLRCISGINLLLNHVDARLAIVSLQADWCDATTLATILDSSFHIATRAGFHCAPLVHEQYAQNTETLRISANALTTHADIDAVIAALREIREQFV